MEKVKVKNHSELSLVVGDVLLNPGDEKMVSRLEVNNFRAVPAGKWYFDNCLTLVKEERTVEEAPQAEVVEEVVLPEMPEDAPKADGVEAPQAEDKPKKKGKK